MDKSWKMAKSWKKSITWNITASAITLLVTFLVTRRLEITLAVGITERVTKLIVYPFHEKFWDER